MNKPKLYKGTGPFPSMLIKNAAVYARVSSPKNRQTKSLDNQISALLEYVDSQRFLRLAGIYVDVGSGRSADSRKELTRLLKDCRSGNVDVIITKSVSRFARNTVDTLNICRSLKEMKVDVFFHSEGIHSIGENGELSITLAAAIAQSDSYAKSENIKWGLEKSAETHDSKLYSRPCYGYERDEDGQLIINKEKADVVKDIYRKYLDGSSVMKIKKDLEERGIPSPSGGVTWPKRTIEKILCNEKYCGYSLYNRTITLDYPEKKRIENTGQRKRFIAEDHHPVIITQELFNEVQAKISARKRVKHDE